MFSAGCLVAINRYHMESSPSPIPTFDISSRNCKAICQSPAWLRWTSTQSKLYFPCKKNLVDYFGTLFLMVFLACKTPFSFKVLKQTTRVSFTDHSGLTQFRYLGSEDSTSKPFRNTSGYQSYWPPKMESLATLLGIARPLALLPINLWKKRWFVLIQDIQLGISMFNTFLHISCVHLTYATC